MSVFIWVFSDFLDIYLDFVDLSVIILENFLAVYYRPNLGLIIQIFNRQNKNNVENARICKLWALFLVEFNVLSSVQRKVVVSSIIKEEADSSEKFINQ